MLSPLRTNSLAIFGVLVLLSTALRAQDATSDAANPAAPADPVVVHIVHCNGSAMDLAKVLQQVAGEGDVTIVPEPINNLLIVRASESRVAHYAELIEELNRPARRITVALTVLETDDPGLIGNADPDELLRTLNQRVIRRIRLTTLENQLAQVQVGEQRPVVDGVMFDRGGRAPVNSYQQQQFGTILSITARVDGDGAIVAELSFEMSRIDDSIAATESADDGVPPVTRTATLQSTISVPDGESILLTDFDSQDDPDETRLIGILTATAE